MALGGQIEPANQAGDIRVCTLLFPRFIAEVEPAYDKARIWYSLPLDAFAHSGVRGATASVSILTTFMVDEKKTHWRLKSEPKEPPERDMQIYELHKAGKTAREEEEMFNLLESRVRVI